MCIIIQCFYWSKDESSRLCQSQETDITQNQDEIEELLIAAVQKRKELWDHRLPLMQRTKVIIAAKWQEIASELDGMIERNNSYYFKYFIIIYIYNL